MATILTPSRPHSVLDAVDVTDTTIYSDIISAENWSKLAILVDGDGTFTSVTATVQVAVARDATGEEWADFPAATGVINTDSVIPFNIVDLCFPFARVKIDVVGTATVSVKAYLKA